MIRDYLLIATASCLLAACGGTAGTKTTVPSANKAPVPLSNKVTVSVAYQSARCNVSVQSVREITDVNQWLSVTKRPMLLSDSGTQLKNVQPQLDFAGSRYFLVSAGSKPTPGYSYSLSSNLAEIAGNRAIVQLVLNGPPAGSMNAAVLTSPCVILKLDTRVPVKIQI